MWFHRESHFWALDQTCSFPLVSFDLQVEQVHFVLSILAMVVIHASSKVWEHLGYLFPSHFLTDDWYRDWVKLNILHSYCSWVLNWSLFLLFPFSLFSFYLFIYLMSSFFLTNNLLCSSFSVNLRPIFKHYLLLLSYISFSVILSKCYLFLY